MQDSERDKEWMQDRHVCMYVCTYACMYACAYVLYMYVCMYAFMYVCMCACMYVCMYMYICMYVCVYVHTTMYVCTYVRRIVRTCAIIWPKCPYMHAHTLSLSLSLCHRCWKRCRVAVVERFLESLYCRSIFAERADFFELYVCIVGLFLRKEPYIYMWQKVFMIVTRFILHLYIQTLPLIHMGCSLIPEQYCTHTHIHTCHTLKKFISHIWICIYIYIYIRRYICVGGARITNTRNTWAHAPRRAQTL